jgi:hypothetical protein
MEKVVQVVKLRTLYLHSLVPSARYNSAQAPRHNGYDVGFFFAQKSTAMLGELIFLRAQRKEEEHRKVIVVF